VRSSESIENIAGALSLIHAEMKNPPKDAKGQVRGNPNYRFASLPAIIDATRPLLASNGISVLQETITTEDGIGCTTRLVHVSGEWIELGPLLLPRAGTAQDNGSALTYARRYSLSAALNLAPDEDDDGAVLAVEQLCTKTGL